MLNAHRGCEGFDNFKLSDYIESYGAELTSEVFEDGMLISIKSLNIYFEKIYLMDLMINKPILSEMQFQIVKNSTLNLIKKEKENPFNICFEKWRKVVYFKHPYAFNSYGYEEDLVNIFFEDVLSEFERFKSRKKYLISNNNKIVEDNLKNKNQKIPNLKSSCLKHHLNQKERFVSSFNLSDQTIIMLGNQTCPRESNEYLQLKLLESYLSFGMSSALFKLFREKNGITYDVGVYNSVKKDNAPFLVYLSVSNKNALFAFNLLIKFWKELLNSQISNEELNLAKEKLKSSYLIKSQSIDEILQKTFN